ncbi:hypothetical protein [Mesorhizobium sp. M0500]|uniref:hypothetical protein n=1 Tax=Mesorhizobium sp. M0500 TaxID=2956953 RepID=UPI0033372453
MQLIARLTLRGIFRLEDMHGRQIAVPSKKARALLAILAFSRNGERSRASLQDMLWGRCEKTESQNSLRRELSSLRALLAGDLADLLHIDRETVCLRLDRCDVDALGEGESAQTNGTLLEGLDIAGEEGFEEWLRERRSQRQTAAPRVTSPGADDTRRSGAQPDRRLVVSIGLDAWHNGAVGAMILPELFRQAVISGLEETGCFRVSVPDPARNGPRNAADAQDLDLLIKTESAYDTLAVAIMCVGSTNRDVMVSMSTVVKLGGKTLALERDLQAFATNCVDRLLHRNILSLDALDDSHLSRKRLLTATAQMFSLSPSDVRASRATLTEANGLSRQGIFHAWRAYQAVFLYDRSHAYDYRLTIEECKDDMRVAMDLDPFNGAALSLCAHVHAFLLQDFTAAGEYLEKARQTGTQNVMYYDAFSMLNFYTGHYSEAREAAKKAEILGKNLTFRYCFATSLCMIEAMSGDFEAAAREGRRALALEPGGREISYPPTLRYCGAALAHLGLKDEARELFGQLRTKDPDIASQKIRNNFGPFPNPRSVELIGSALASVGL